MSGIYEEVEIEDMKYDDGLQTYTYPCPCGDKFSITLEELYDGEDIANCPSCTLRIRVIFDEDKLPALREENQDEDGEGGGKIGASGEEKGKDDKVDDKDELQLAKEKEEPSTQGKDDEGKI